MTKFKNFINEMTKFSKEQKDDLAHFIINVLSNYETAKLLRSVNKTSDEVITIKKREAIVILSNLEKIRQFIIDLPRSDEK